MRGRAGLAVAAVAGLGVAAAVAAVISERRREPALAVDEGQPAPGAGAPQQVTREAVVINKRVVPAPEVEEPIIVLDEEVAVTGDVPGGTDLSNLSNKTFDSTGVVEAYGVGGGAAGAYGQRWGRGALAGEGGGDAAHDVPLPPADPRAADDGFIATEGEGLASTFAIDVDTAAYAVVRQALRRGVRPAPGSVRLEELINYFPYDDAPPAPDATTPVAARAEVAPAPWASGRRLVRVALRARDVVTRPPSNLVFLIDVSGSMRAPGKLPLVKRALGLLVRQLSENDRVALVVYAGASGLVLPSTCCDDPRPILEAIERLEAGGSTNGGAGIELAYRTAVDNFVPGGTNRVLLLTDGDWNVGATSQPALEGLIAEKAKTGVFLTVLGFDMYGRADATMERLADRGDGMYAFVDGEREAKKVLVQQVLGTLVTVARDVKVQVAWDPARVARWRLVGYENRRLKNSEFRDDKKDAGEVGAGHGVTALYEVVPRGDQDLGHGPIATLRVRWKAPEAALDDPARELVVPVVDAGGTFTKASADLRFTTAVAAFGLSLRGQAPDGAGLATVRGWAEGALGDDPHGLRGELVDLIRRAEALEPPPPPAEAESAEDTRTSSSAAPDAGCGGEFPASTGSLRWLKEHQAEDGRWDVDSWGAACRAQAPCGPETGRVDARRDVGLTATVLLAYLADGQTHRFGAFRRTVNKALRWLMSRQADDGRVRGEVDHAAALDDHLLATIALCESFAISRDFTLKRPCRLALEACLAVQQPDGGWSRGDAGVAGASVGPDDLARGARALLALRGAQVAGLEVSAPALARAREWLAARTAAHDLGRAGPHDPWRCAASLSVFARLLAGEAPTTPFMREAARALTGRVEGDGPCAWYAPTLAAFQLDRDTWRAWSPAMEKAIHGSAATTGCERGSWAPAPSCGIGGRVEATALARLCLGTSYRYERAEQRPEASPTPSAAAAARAPEAR